VTLGAVRLARGSYAVSGVTVAGAAAIVGKKEGEGPLGGAFDAVWTDDLAGRRSWEAAEAALSGAAVERAIQAADWTRDDVDAVIAGDLLNQLYSTNFAARGHQIPLLGTFAACATFTESIALGALLLAASGPQRVVVAAASHHLAAERQFRFPVELGYQRTPTASWTATAAGALALEAGPGAVGIESVTVGRVVDLGARDPMDMGTAMAPAAADCLLRHRAAVGRGWEDYDRIYTGDLGVVGSRILADLLGGGEREVSSFVARHEDCGRALYSDRQDAHNGGSGAGLAAAVFSGSVLPQIRAGHWRRVLLVATGALFSPTSYQQGETIPGIAHAIEFTHVQARP
jgi:stage V sporulation protein AD